MDKEQLLYRVGMTMLPAVGDISAKNLISYFGGEQEVFSASYAKLLKVPGIGEKTAKAIAEQDVLKEAEQEVKFIEKQNIQPLWYLDKAYPQRLRNCYDAPVLLYYKGNADLNNARILSIVGTRNATDYGKEFCEKLVEALSPLKVLIVSGLAYGIDICAHKSALKNGLPTVAALGHGLDRLYPAQHNSTAKGMLEQGGLLTDFPSGSRFDKENFPKRNRLIAGMTDATVVIETKVKGGSMITAELANSYNREVFAVPGNINVETSAGCNHLIKNHKAILLDEVEELIETMGWQEDKVMNNLSAGFQQQLFQDLPAPELALVELLRGNGRLRIDEISLRSGLSGGQVAADLLNLEIKGLIRVLPGKMYELRQ